MFGVLNINKPPGLTSRDVVNRIARLARPHKAGHAGTLDPLATGVLLVCLGPATRLVEYAHRLRKSYRATFHLGCSSETDDIEAEVIQRPDLVVPTERDLKAALPRFLGEIAQRPPRHSAIKIAGQRAYKLARRGVEFEPAEKIVRIDRLEIVRYESPVLVLDIDCGSGVYVRSLGRDLAASLGSCAVMAALERRAIGDFTLTEASELQDLLSDPEWTKHIRPAASLVGGMPTVRVTDAERTELCHGRPLHWETGRVPLPSAVGAEIAALDAAGRLAAIVVQRAPGELWPTRNFAQPA